MAQYEFDSMRWCRTMAKAHWMRNEHDISSTFRTVAEEIDRMREALRVTAGNIKSLGPAGAIGPGREYEEWLRLVEAALVGEER